MADLSPGDRLKRYWTRGEGAIRLAWGTDGDWTRCHQALTEHVGDARARRICAEWHMEMNGFWPGDRRNQ